MDYLTRKNIQFSVPKVKANSFIDQEIKKHNIVPGVGNYDFTKADKVLTAGASKGWK